MLEECQILLSLQETDLKVWEAKLPEEQVHGLHSFDRRDLSTELEEGHVRVAGVNDECTTEAGELSVLIVEASNALVDLGIVHIQGVPQLLKMAQEVLKAVDLILEHLLEEHNSDVGPWD
jgi:hypothetical protein